jgi:FO synthase
VKRASGAMPMAGGRSAGGELVAAVEGIWLHGGVPPRELLAGCADLPDETLPRLLGASARLRDEGRGRRVTFSRKVFIPLTRLCRDVCRYCAFAQAPRQGRRAYLTLEEVLAVARAGQTAGCHEALFTLGDKPELRYPQARAELEAMGYPRTLDYLAAAARAVLGETGLLPHANAGVMDRADLLALRPCCPSQGLMLESASDRLCEPGGPHSGSPDKRPAARLATLEAAGQARVPFTSGILVGIGETRAERVEALLAIRELHRRHGHIQEVIVQNFRAKPGTPMAGHPEPDLADVLWTLAVARLVLGPEANLQAPPNLTPAYERLLEAGVNDWGGVSPVTPDHVNPEAPWPHLEDLRRRTEAAGFVLAERLTVHPEYLRDPETWLAPEVRAAVLRASDAEGLAHEGGWHAGADTPAPLRPAAARPALLSPPLTRILDRAAQGRDLSPEEVERLFAARGPEFEAVCEAADGLRREAVGDEVTYVVNRNINYTNICTYRCGFCAFSKGKLSENLRGRPYLVATEEILRRCREAWARGATEVCMQGGIHPEFTGSYYLELLRAVKRELPDLDVHAFSPLEVWQGAATLGVSVPEFLCRLKDAGLSTLPGTAAEILDDEVRALLCPDKLKTAEWAWVVEEAHRAGLRTTCTVMFGHLERPVHWARHLLLLRDIQKRTGGFTEIVPLAFVHMEAPLYLKGRARRGPTFREAVLMHAVSRLALHPWIRNVQTSWVKMGVDGARACLAAGANDLGGTLMNESISRAAGASHGQELPPADMERLVRAEGRTPRQRTTLYGDAPEERRRAALAAPPLLPVVPG